MNIAVEMKPAGTSIRALVEANPVLVLIEPEKFEPFFAMVKEECDALVPDLTSKKGRDAIKAQAFKVTRTKTAIDDAGKKLNETARAQINKVDASRRDIKARLEALAEDVRKPLTEWEAKEGERLDYVKTELAELRGAPNFPQSFKAVDVADEIARLKGLTFDPAIFQDEIDTATYLRDAAVLALDAAHTRLVKAEEDAAELERLRAEKEERDRAEAERVRQETAERRRAENENALAAQILDYIKTVRMGFIGGQPQSFGILLYELERKIKLSDYAERHRDAIDAARVEALTHLTELAESSERRRQAKEDAEAQEKIIAAAREAEDRAKREAERKHQAEISKAQAEADRLKREEAERVAEAKRIADEEAARAANQAHRTKIKAAAKAALMTCGADEETAKKIVVAIIAGEIPAVSLKF